MKDRETLYADVKCSVWWLCSPFFSGTG